MKNTVRLTEKNLWRNYRRKPKRNRGKVSEKVWENFRRKQVKNTTEKNLRKNLKKNSVIFMKNSQILGGISRGILNNISTTTPGIVLYNVLRGVLLNTSDLF